MNVQTRLREADPARHTDIPTPDSEVGRSVFERSTAEPLGATDPRTGTNPGDRRARPRRAVRITLVAALPVALAVVLVVILLPGTEGSAPSAAAATFGRLALEATTVPTSLGPGQYYYTETDRPTYQIAVTTSPGHSFDEYLNGVVQTWVAADGSGRVVTTTDPTPQFFTAGDRAAWVAAGSPPAAVPPGQLTTVQQLGPDSGSEVNGPIPLYDVSALPTDPTELSQVLSNGESNGSTLASLPSGISSLDYVSDCATQACALFERAVDLLQGPDIGMTAALRAALYQVLAAVPGVSLLGTTTDPAGQSGIGVSLVEHQPAKTGTIVCQSSPGGMITHYVKGGVVLTPTTGPTTPTTTVTYIAQTPASTTTFTVVVDPQSTTVLSSEESFSPSTQPVSTGCGGRGTTQEVELSPTWRVVVSQGVVGSDTAVPPAGS